MAPGQDHEVSFGQRETAVKALDVQATSSMRHDVEGREVPARHREAPGRAQFRSAKHGAAEAYCPQELAHLIPPNRTVELVHLGLILTPERGRVNASERSA